MYYYCNVTVEAALAVTVGTMQKLRLKRIYGLSEVGLLLLFSPFKGNKKNQEIYFAMRIRGNVQSSAEAARR